MTAERVAAFAAVIEALAVTGALLFAWRQLTELAAARRDQSRAYVVAYLSFDPELREFPNLVVENLGTTAAYDITLEADPPLRSSFDQGAGPAVRDVGMLQHGIATLAPGQRVVTLFDSMYDRPQDWEDTYRIDVTYRDRSNDVRTDTFTLDLVAMKHSTYVGEKGLRALNDHIEQLTKEVHQLRTGSSGPLQVEVEDRSARRARLIEEHAQRVAEIGRRRPQRPADD